MHGIIRLWNWGLIIVAIGLVPLIISIGIGSIRFTSMKALNTSSLTLSLLGLATNLFLLLSGKLKKKKIKAEASRWIVFWILTGSISMLFASHPEWATAIRKWLSGILMRS